MDDLDKLTRMATEAVRVINGFGITMQACADAFSSAYEIYDSMRRWDDIFASHIGEDIRRMAREQRPCLMEVKQ